MLSEKIKCYAGRSWEEARTELGAAGRLAQEKLEQLEGDPKNSDGVGPGYATGFRCGQRAL